jgi:hypothetical protein
MSWAAETPGKRAGPRRFFAGLLVLLERPCYSGAVAITQGESNEHKGRYDHGTSFNTLVNITTSDGYYSTYHALIGAAVAAPAQTGKPACRLNSSVPQGFTGPNGRFIQSRMHAMKRGASERQGTHAS